MSEEYIKEELIRVVYVEPGKKAKVIELDNTLKAMKEAVGGLIEAAYFYDEPVAIVCNDEGKINGMPLNRAIYDEHSGKIKDIMAGSFFVCYAPPFADDFQSLPKNLEEKYLKKFMVPETFVITADGIKAIPMKEKNRTLER